MVVTSEKRDNSQKPLGHWLSRALLDVISSEWDILAFSTAFKLLLFPT
jgi:hypothetical protein